MIYHCANHDLIYLFFALKSFFTISLIGSEYSPNLWIIDSLLDFNISLFVLTSILGFSHIAFISFIRIFSFPVPNCLPK